MHTALCMHTHHAASWRTHAHACKHARAGTTGLQRKQHLAAHTPAHTVVVLTEKPNRTVPSKGASKEAVAAAAEMLHELSYLKNTDLTPTERLALPITGNMEYGFFTVAPPKPNPMFDYKTRTCDVTQYATQFSMSTGARQVRAA